MNIAKKDHTLKEVLHSTPKKGQQNYRTIGGKTEGDSLLAGTPGGWSVVRGVPVALDHRSRPAYGLPQSALAVFHALTPFFGLDPALVASTDCVHVCAQSATVFAGIRAFYGRDAVRIVVQASDCVICEHWGKGAGTQQNRDCENKDSERRGRQHRC